ncbi:MAG TPA: YCF48-related protein [Ignavibacteria bacterium]|nr:YCF48-related protein [Ignavibacteria bacterium]
MKFPLYIILTFLILTELHSQTYWLRQQSPTSQNLKNVFFINSSTGWISGDSGFIARTNDSGNNWTIQNTNVINDIQALFFINERLGWAVTWEIFPDSTSFLGTRILKTTNGGDEWITYMYPEENRFIKSIYFLDSANGFFAGAPLSILYTTDAGMRWNFADTDTSLIIGFPVENIKFVDSQTGYACGGFRDIAGSMWVSTNGGYNWRASVVGPEPLNDLYIFNNSNAIASGGDFEYGSSTVRTTNLGNNWLYDTLGTFGVASGIDFRTAYEGWITLGIAQKFAYTKDTGRSWTNIFTPDSMPVFDVDFTDSIQGWAVGYSGCILKYNPSLVSINSNYETHFPESFILYQNYPNPFNPATVINYVLRTDEFVTLKIFDIAGKEILTLINDYQKSGKYSFRFSGENYPSGVYYYKLSSGSFSQVRKMVLLK